ncbi:MAG: 2-C-methyl-D-erythritol 2,4-cyclodiphosphate synthase [Pseudomonadota bacterium]|nr:2-C-methyl-D-erythritol 2,4-cyclodiphosphate synthase [Pseudomonadota bacterium]
MNKKKNNKLAIAILASGLGERFGGSIPKQYKKIDDKLIIEHTLENFIKNTKVKDIYIVYNEKHKSYIYPLKQKYKSISFVLGDKSRQKSALKAITLINKKRIYKHILIHDAVRPFASTRLINNIIRKLSTTNAVIPVIQINDSVKVIRKRKVIKNIDRSELFLSQTPQGFYLKDIVKAYSKINLNKLSNYTDDAQILIDAGFEVNIINGEENNFKITNKNDLVRAQNMICNQKILKVGQGIDIHAFTNGRNFKLFGTNIPFNRSIKAHSDGDVGIHALIDAILGTLSSGDIGAHFPDSHKKYKDVDSLILLKKTYDLLNKNKGKIVHIDNTIVCEKPKLRKYIEKMRGIISNLLNLDIKSVSIKATTSEKLGFIGKNEGIAVLSIVTISFENEK